MLRDDIPHRRLPQSSWTQHSLLRTSLLLQIRCVLGVRCIGCASRKSPIEIPQRQEQRETSSVYSGCSHHYSRLSALGRVHDRIAHRGRRDFFRGRSNCVSRPVWPRVKARRSGRNRTQSSATKIARAHHSHLRARTIAEVCDDRTDSSSNARADNSRRRSGKTARAARRGGRNSASSNGCNYSAARPHPRISIPKSSPPPISPSTPPIAQSLRAPNLGATHDTATRPPNPRAVGPIWKRSSAQTGSTKSAPPHSSSASRSF